MRTVRSLRLTLGLGLMLVMTAALVAQRAVTFERLLITDGPVALSTATTDPVGQAQITACEGRLETAQARAADQRAVTVGATTGRLYEIGDIVTISGHDFAANLRFAKTGSTTAELRIECWP